MAVLGAHPARLDLVVHPGDPVDVAEPVLDGSGAAQDLSGWTLAATVTAPDGTALHTFTPTVYSTSSVRLTADADVTAAWDWSVYAGRLKVTVTPPGGGPVPVVTGWVRLYKP